MSVALRSAVRRRVRVALGASWLPRSWPCEAADYDVEISPDGVRVRLAPRGRWYGLSWEALLPLLDGERSP